VEEAARASDKREEDYTAYMQDTLAWLRFHIRNQRTWELLDAPGITGATDLSSFQQMAVDVKARAVHGYVTHWLQCSEKDSPLSYLPRRFMTASSMQDFVGDSMGIGGRSVRRYWSEFREYQLTNGVVSGKFKPAGTGKYERNFILRNEDFKMEFELYIRTNLKGLSVDTTWKYVNEQLLANRSLEMLESYGISRPVCRETVRQWMHSVGCVQDWHKKSYYVDRHEDKDVVAKRKEYIALLDKLEPRMRYWVVVTEEVEARLMAEHAKKVSVLEGESSPAFPAGDVVTIHGSLVLVHHMDDLAVFDNETLFPRVVHPSSGVVPVKPSKVEWNRKKMCKHRHEYETCLCWSESVHIGQDESIYASLSYSRAQWTIGDVSVMRPKTEGAKVMISIFQDEVRGFSWRLTAEELEIFNDWREERNKTRVTADPTIQFFHHGKNKEGYWDAQNMLEQTEQVIDLWECFFPGIQLIGEFDQSGAHMKGQEGALRADYMNVNWGGKGHAPRNVELAEDCVGEEIAVLYQHSENKEWRLNVTDADVQSGKWVKKVCKVRPSGDDGAVQSFVFVDGDAPPYYDLQAPAKDEWVSEEEYDRRRGGRSKAKVTRNEQGQLLIPGYEGKPKGLKQIAWERGFKVNGLNKNVITKKLSACSDFANELSALQELFRSRGHIAINSPICHPEIAGKGVEYSLGMSKRQYRKENLRRACNGKNLEARVAASITHVPLESVKRFAARTRRYRKAYRDDNPATHKEIEKFQKMYKTHRNILDMECAVLEAELMRQVQRVADMMESVSDPPSMSSAPMQEDEEERDEEDEDDDMGLLAASMPCPPVSHLLVPPDDDHSNPGDDAAAVTCIDVGEDAVPMEGVDDGTGGVGGGPPGGEGAAVSAALMGGSSIVGVLVGLEATQGLLNQ